MITVVVPCYKVAGSIEGVVAGLPPEVSAVVLVDDASPDATAQALERLRLADPRVRVVSHARNQGVGGAMVTGFREALALGADVVVKVDGDGQMDSAYIVPMAQAVARGECDMAKGNRFQAREMIRRMPAVRRAGNLGVGFLVKIASGYWDIVDPANGFVCLSAAVLRRVDMERLDRRFFFESSLLIELFYAGARIKDVAMPAIYADEVSNLSVWRTLLAFPPKLARAFARRVWLRYFVYDFNICSLYILFGAPLFLFGVVFGAAKWAHFASISLAAPTGTVMIALLAIVLGFQMLLAAVQYDMTARNPFERGA